MRKLTSLLLCSLLLLPLAGQAQDELLDVQWMDLLSQADLDAMLNPPPMSHDLGWQSQLDANPEADAFAAALESVNVNEELLNKRIQIPGFVVPTAVNEERKVTEFLLVPFFGACTHLPPPPPNQIVYVNFDEGIELESIYDAHQVRGVLTNEVIRDGEVTSAYRLRADSVEIMDPEAWQ